MNLMTIDPVFFLVAQLLSVAYFIKNILKETGIIDRFYNDHLHIQEHFLTFMISV